MSDTQFEYYTNTFTTNSMTYGVNYTAMTFTLGTVGPNLKHQLTSIKLRISRSGTLSGDFTISIFDTSGGKPVGSALTTLTIAGSTLGTTASWKEYTITDVLVLDASTMFAIVVAYPSGDLTHYVRLHRTTGGYAGGSECDSGNSGSTWSIDTHDIGFYEYGLEPVNLTENPNETINISDALVITGDCCGLGTIKIKYGGNLTDFICLHKPYPNSADGSLSFSNTNMSFRSGHYASYIDEINDEVITLCGYEDIDAMTKFVILSDVADLGSEITITNLSSEYNGVYIISSFSYNPIGLDVFEYRMNLKFVRP